MDFARRQLLKYGWEEGKGLGKNENGISQALKPKLKFDNSGVGHDGSEQFTYKWWENVYNHAADNINVVKTEEGDINVQLIAGDSVDITTKKYSMKNLKKKNKKLEYGSFLKTSKLTEDGTVDHEDKIITTEEALPVLKTANLTDDELFAACGGRTAHKGARHGLKLNGKLARIEEQERLLLENLQGKSMTENKEIVVKKEPVEMQESLSDEELYIKSKKAKKKNCKKEINKNMEESMITEEKKCKKSKKRSHSEADYEEFIDQEAARKRTEYCCDKQKRKQMKIRKRKEDRKISKMADMLENVCVLNPDESNKDDGFVETSAKKIKLGNSETNEKKLKKKHKKSKRKLNMEVEKSSEDDGFEEYISEVNEKLIYYKVLRKDLQNEKKKSDDKRITKMAEGFENIVEM